MKNLFASLLVAAFVSPAFAQDHGGAAAPAPGTEPAVTETTTKETKDGKETHKKMTCKEGEKMNKKTHKCEPAKM